MSYLMTREPARGEVAIRNNCDDITSDALNSIYQTKLEFAIRKPKNGATFPLVISSTDQSSRRVKVQGLDTIPVDDNSTGVSSSTNSPSNFENSEDQSHTGVETKSCGKISALISHFKNVEATSARPEKAPFTNVPAKRLRMEFQSVSDNDNSTTKRMDIASTNQEIETGDKTPKRNSSLPAVRLNFKVHLDEAAQHYQNQIVKNKATKNTDHFIPRNNITTKPLVIPRSFKNDHTDHTLLRQSDNVSKEACTSERSRLLPISDDSTLDHISSDTVEVESLQRCEQPSSNGDISSNFHPSDCGDTAAKPPQDFISYKVNQSQSSSVATIVIDSCATSEDDIVCNLTVADENNTEVKSETYTVTSTHCDQTDYNPTSERLFEKDETPAKNEDASKVSPLIAETTQFTDKPNNVELLEDFEKEKEIHSGEVTATYSATGNNNFESDETRLKAKNKAPSLVNSEPIRRCVPEIKVSFDGDDGLVTDKYTDIGLCDVGGKHVSASGVEDKPSSLTKYGDVSDRINVKLDLLKSELMAMRKMDLVLLRQLIKISQTMQRIQRADVLRVSRSMSFLSRNMTMPRRCRPVERQNSAPHCADRRRFLFSHLRANTEDDFRDSLSSFDESEADSAPSEVEESTTSLNSLFANSPRAATNRQKFFQSHDLLVSLDVAEDAEQNYEDILSRNVRLWKISVQEHPSVQEEMNLLALDLDL